MDRQTANKLDRLLADGELSAPEAEAIFDRVYAAVAPAKRPARPWIHLVWGAGALAAATAAGLLWLRVPDTAPGHFRARGEPGHQPRIDVSCSQGTLDACPLSSTLVFMAAGERAAGHLSAYAQPLEPGFERVWYFSREGVSPLLAGPADETRTFDRGIRLSGTHRPGRYRLHVFLSSEPLQQVEMLAVERDAGVRAQAQFDLTVVGE